MTTDAAIVDQDPRKTVAKMMREMSPEEFIATLRLIAWNCDVDHHRLASEWINPNTGEPDVNAGKVWDIAAIGLNKTADTIEKHWDTI